MTRPSAGGIAGDAAGIDPPSRRFFDLRDSAGNPNRLLKRSIRISISVARPVAVILVAATGSTVTPVNPAVFPDSSATPNPISQRK